MELSKFGNQYFDSEKPWEIVKENKEKAGEIIYNCIQIINALKILFYPFMPNAAERLHKILNLENTVEEGEWKFSEIKPGHKLSKPEILFAKVPEERIEEEMEILKKK